MANADEDEWKAFDNLKTIMNENKQFAGKISVEEDNMEAEISFWRETFFANYARTINFHFDMKAMKNDRFLYWDRIASTHTCDSNCSFKNLQKGFRFRIDCQRVYEASGILFVCVRTLKPHFCGSKYCVRQILPTNSSRTVCALTGRVISENIHFSLANSREDPDVRVAGNLMYQKHLYDGGNDDFTKSNELVSATASIMDITQSSHDYNYCIRLIQEKWDPVKVIQLAKNRSSWRLLANRIYNEQVMTSHYAKYQQNAIRDAHKNFMENVDSYVKRCVQQRKRYDIMHILFLFNQYEKPAYRGVYFTGDVDEIKKKLQTQAVNVMLDVWQKLSESQCVQRDNFTFQMCARGILVVMAGHSADHDNGLCVQLKIDRKTGEPSRITEQNGTESVDLVQYEIREFNFIPRVDGLILAPASIVNQEKSNRKKSASKKGSSSRLIVSNNTRNKKGNGVGKRSTGSNRNEGRMPSVKNLHSIITEIIESAKTLADIERFCYMS